MKTKNTSILSFDLGKTFGWCFLDAIGPTLGSSKYIDLIDWGNQFTELLETWKPSMVVLSQTNSYGHWNASRCMLQQAGVAFYICGRRDIPGIELNDSQARKLILGKAYKKKEVQQMYLTIQPDALDAMILAQAWQKLQVES